MKRMSLQLQIWWWLIIEYAVESHIHASLPIILLCCSEYRPEYERLHRELVSNLRCGLMYLNTSHPSTSRALQNSSFINRMSYVKSVKRLILNDICFGILGWSSKPETTGTVETPSERHGSSSHGNHISKRYIHSAHLCSFKKNTWNFEFWSFNQFHGWFFHQKS